MTKFPLNLAPGASVIAETRGSFLYFESASAGGMDTSIKIVISGAKGGEVILQVGQGFKLDIDFDRLTISNNIGQGTIIGQLVISDGNFFDHRVIGTVSVVDGGKSRSLSGNAFISALYSGPTAGNIDALQVFNPATSTVNLIVEKIYVSSGTAQVIKVGYNAVANGVVIGSPPSKKAGGPLSVAQAIVTSSPVNPVGFAFYAQIQVQASQTMVMELREPLVIPPGYGLNILTNTPGTDISTTIEFYQDGV